MNSFAPKYEYSSDRLNLACMGFLSSRRAGLQGTEPEEELVDHLISAFRRALQFLNEVQNQLQCRKLSFEFSTHLSGMLRVNDIDQYVLLFNANNDRVMANAKIFLQTGGLGVVKELHSLLLAQSWDKICHIDLQLLERALLRLLLPVCAAIPKQEHHNIVNLLDNIVGSFLRVSISSQHMALPDNPRLSTTSRADQFQVLAEVIVTALQCICRWVDSAYLMHFKVGFSVLRNQYSMHILKPR